MKNLNINLFVLGILFALNMVTTFCIADENLVSDASQVENIRLPEKDKFHLYLLIGQSNMVGRDNSRLDTTPHPRILVFNNKNQWSYAIDPLHSEPYAGVGPGLSFAKRMVAEDPLITIGLIPCAVSATSLEQWEKGGGLYKNAAACATEGMKYGTLKGVLWHQGEGDAMDTTSAITYAGRLTQMIRDFRQELGLKELPFVVGKLGIFAGKHKRFPYIELVNKALESIPNRVSFAACVDSGGLKDKGDNLHFDSESERELGKRYAEQMIRLQKDVKIAGKQ